MWNPFISLKGFERFFFFQILLGFLRRDRPDVVEPDMSIAEGDAKDLVRAFVDRKAVDKNSIIRIFSTRNSVQLTAALDIFRQMYGLSAGKVEFL